METNVDARYTRDEFKKRCESKRTQMLPNCLLVLLIGQPRTELSLTYRKAPYLIFLEEYHQQNECQN